MKPARHVSATELREAFARERILERANVGELWTIVRKDAHPSPGPAGEPHCTRSQIIYYYEGLTRVAVAHQYLRRDGSLGASGMPDPKRLLVGDEILFVGGRGD